MIYIGIDPGPKYTAIVELRDGEVIDAQKLDNDEVLHRLQHYYSRWVARCNQFCFTCEMIASYGMAVGAEVFETCVWIGRFLQVVDGNMNRVNRITVKTHLCHSAKAKDPNVRQALIDRLGPQGTKKKPGPTYGVSGDMWAALAVAVWTMDNDKENASEVA